MADQQGTGKHPHKSTEQPYPHHATGERGGHESRGHESQGRGSGRKAGSEEGLQAREYRDAQGNEHHHTKTYMEQHDKK